MTSIANGELGLSVRAKLNDLLTASDALTLAVTDAQTAASDAELAAASASATAAALTGFDLAAIAASKSITAVDGFVYDTSKDTDGGAWRKRTQGTSWYNETLNTATRGSRREFPAVAVIVAESNKVTIFDGDDPSLPMWRVCDFTGYTIKAVAAGQGEILVATTVGLVVLDIVVDRISVAVKYSTATNPAIVNANVNDVAMTVLPNAPIDPATGLQVPRIHVGTAGGQSVIVESSVVYDSAKTTACTKLAIDAVGNIVATYADGTSVVTAQSVITADGFTGTTLNTTASPAILGTATSLAKGAFGSSSGLTLLSSVYDMSALLTSTYNTGWMVGAIKGAWLSDTSATALVGGTVADRSVNANPLNVYGTITRIPVATGANLVGYSGFSAANYLEQPYNSALDFGTGDFCVMGWVKASAATRYIFDRADAAYTGGRISLYRASAGNIRATLTGTANLDSGVELNDKWQFVVLKRASGVLYLSVNAGTPATAANTSVLSNATATTRLGLSVGGLFPCGSMALWRISATAESAAGIAKIYNDEKFLFQDGAQATLYGTSDAVTALAYDDDTNLLSVGTSAGRSDFQGLRRVANTTTAVSTFISANASMIVEQ